jgi:hypothetical protein
MTGFYHGIRVNRQSKARGKKPGRLNCNNIKGSITKKWFFAIICLLFVVCGSGVAKPQVVRADDEGYLLDRVITWADGTTEHVQIGQDAFFYLDGQKKYLVGVTIIAANPNSKREVEIWRPENLTFLDKQLTYLQSVGIRLCRVSFRDIINSVSNTDEEAAAESAYLNLFYQHKMLVIMLPDVRDEPLFNGSLDPADCVINKHDTVSQWITRLADIASKYSNIVAICADNELDNKWGWETYSTSQAKAYFTLLTGIFRSKMDVVITHNLMTNDMEKDIKQMVLSQVDIPGASCYGTSPEAIKTNLDWYLPWSGINNNGWWCIELGYDRIDKSDKEWKQVFDSSQVTPSYIDAVFDRGATVALLFLSICTTNPEFSLFDDGGNAKPNLVAIASEVPRLQAGADVSSAQQFIAQR